MSTKRDRHAGINTLINTFTTAALAALALCLFGPGVAHAQQWTTSSNGAGNISNGNSGNVGVGTMSPTYELHVEGQSTAANNFTQGYFKNTSTTNPYGGVAVDGRNQSHVRFMLGGSLKWQWRVVAGTGADDLRAFSWTLGRDVLTMSNGGNVGIGTDAPAAPLHVAGAPGLPGFMMVSGSGAAVINFKNITGPADAKHYQWRSEGGVFRMSLINDAATDFAVQNILVANSAGNVGVGTSSPAYRLHVSQGSVGIQNAGGDAALVTTSGAAGESLTTGWSAGGYGYLQGGVWGVAARDVVLQGGGGSVGIGTRPNQSYRLDVAGSIRASADLNVEGAITGGTMNAVYQDVAEWVPSTQKFAAGTVVVLDAERANHVVASTTSYDTKVAGVVSARPGISLGEAGEGKALVATTGRVKVKADATRSPIHVGDLLVTSDTEGFAMKSVPVDLGCAQIHRPGTIIGKALESLKSGTGEILVLLSLQ